MVALLCVASGDGGCGRLFTTVTSRVVVVGNGPSARVPPPGPDHCVGGRPPLRIETAGGRRSEIWFDPIQRLSVSEGGETPYGTLLLLLLLLCRAFGGAFPDHHHGRVLSGLGLAPCV